MRLLFAAGAIGAVLAAGEPVAAQPFTLEGLTFSDEMGGFEILDARGRGTRADPFVIVEEVKDPDQAVLVIRGMTSLFANRVGTHHQVGFAMVKIVRNATQTPWGSYDLELREVMESHSPYGDGLSFGQSAHKPSGAFTSSVFRWNEEIDEPYDLVGFRDGIVRPGESASFELIVTDTSPVSRFFLLQQPFQQVAGRHGPVAQIAERPRCCSH